MENCKASTQKPIPVWELWQQGVKEGLMKPQFYGREHLNLKVFEYTGFYSHQLTIFLTEFDVSFSFVPGLEIKRSLGIAKGKDSPSLSIC